MPSNSKGASLSEESSSQTTKSLQSWYALQSHQGQFDLLPDPADHPQPQPNYQDPPQNRPHSIEEGQQKEEAKCDEAALSSSLLNCPDEPHKLGCHR